MNPKPFQGIINSPEPVRLGYPVYGHVVKHMDHNIPATQEYMASGHRIRTSDVVARELYDTFELVETRNSFYIVVTP